MLKKLKAALRLGVPTGSNTLSYESTKALIDRSLLELRKLEERRRFLEEHMKPWYSEAQYQGALHRIEASQRRILAKLRACFARIEQIESAGESRGVERMSLATRNLVLLQLDDDSDNARKSW